MPGEGKEAKNADGAAATATGNAHYTRIEQIAQPNPTAFLPMPMPMPMDAYPTTHTQLFGIGQI